LAKSVLTARQYGNHYDSALESAALETHSFQENPSHERQTPMGIWRPLFYRITLRSQSDECHCFLGKVSFTEVTPVTFVMGCRSNRVIDDPSWIETELILFRYRLIKDRDR
jgi:hypothetical protein